MKKLLSQFATVGCLIASVCSINAYAEHNKDHKEHETTAKPVMFADSPVITLTTQLESRLSLTDSSQKSQVYFFNDLARLGVNVSYGRLTGKLNLNFEGNPVGSDPAFHGEVGVREAWLNYSLLKKLTSYELTLKMGRFLPNGATTYGADPTAVIWSGAGNFDSADGLALNLDANVGGNATVTAQLAAVSSMPVYKFFVNKSNDTMLDGTNAFGIYESGFGKEDKPDNKLGFIGSLKVSSEVSTDVKVDAALAYGAKSQVTVTQASIPALPIKAVGADAAVNADFGYFEGSAGVTYKSLTVGAWLSNAKESNFKAGGVDVPNADSITVSTYGVGVQMDSTMLGMTDIVSKGDSFFGGFGLQSMAQKTSGSSDTKGDSMLIGAGAGYQNGMFNVSLNYAHFSSDGKNFNDDEGKPTDSSSRLYITTKFEIN